MTTPDDDTAIDILKTIAQAHLQPTSAEFPPSPDLRAVLAGVFEDSVSMPASEGELALAALDVLAEEPAFAEQIQIMAGETVAQVRASRQRSYLDPSSIALTTAALLVLQTRVKFKLDHNGKWSIEIEKKGSGDGALKVLAQRLLSVLQGR